MGERARGRLYTYRYPVTNQNDSCIKMGSDESHFNVSLIVGDKVTGQCPQITTFEEKGAPNRLTKHYKIKHMLLIEMRCKINSRWLAVNGRYNAVNSKHNQVKTGNNKNTSFILASHLFITDKSILRQILHNIAYSAQDQKAMYQNTGHGSINAG